jgi:hypothetical protein
LVKRLTFVGHEKNADEKYASFVGTKVILSRNKKREKKCTSLVLPSHRSATVLGPRSVLPPSDGGGRRPAAATVRASIHAAAAIEGGREEALIAIRLRSATARG